ncbi:MAG: hypothetical protein AAGA80_05715 [Cyanobacteria bacterium P01_F01_bin.143]
MFLAQKTPMPERSSNVSLVAFYGDKPWLLSQLIKNIQDYLTRLPEFIPYQIEQIHATVLGCEGWKTASGIISKWFYQRRKEIRYLDGVGWVEYLQDHGFRSFDVYLGGYDRDRDYNFLSRHKHPYHRSFQLQKVNETSYIPILIGWPQRKGLITQELDQLRRDAQRFNLLHKYHEQTDNIDNDFYLRLGTINSSLSAEAIAAVEHHVREALRTRPSIKLSFSQDNLAFAQYQDLSLALATTKIISLREITGEQLLKLY